MYQKFFTKTIESKFIKNLLYNTALPRYKVVTNNDYIFEGYNYIYHDQIILCTKSGYVYEHNFRTILNYEFGKRYPKFTENYISEYGYYDSDTHEWLGNYLRYIKDLFHINLMPFYNCYSGKWADNVSIKIDREAAIINEDANITLPKGRIRGDINGDGLIDKQDYQLLINHLEYLKEHSEDPNWDELKEWAADVNNDGIVDDLDKDLLERSTDVAYIIMGSISNFAPGKLPMEDLPIEATDLTSSSWQPASHINTAIAENVYINAKVKSGRLSFSSGKQSHIYEAPVLNYTVNDLYVLDSDNPGRLPALTKTDVSVSKGDTSQTKDPEFEMVEKYGNYIYDLDLKTWYIECAMPATYEESQLQSLYNYDILKDFEKLGDDKLKIYLKRVPTESEVLSLSIGFINYSIIEENSLQYKVAQIPIRFNKTYTIALDANSSVLIRPAFIKNNKYQQIAAKDNSGKDYSDVFNDSLVLKNNLSFKKPFTYRLDLDPKIEGASKLFENENNLYLLIQIPRIIETSITVLEGDYTTPGNCIKIYDKNSLINDEISMDDQDKLFISDLSLLKLNDKNSYAFSDRLIEYLTLNAITPIDDIDKNFTLVQNALGLTTENYVNKGIWSAVMREAIFNSTMENLNVEHYDIIGFLDKTAEKTIL